MKKVRVILCRHTQTNPNAEGRYSGQLDVPINDTGRSQAIRLAVDLAKQPIARVYTSDLIRTIQVGDMIKSYHQGIVLVSDRRLREVSLGKMDGMSKQEAQAHYPVATLSTKHPQFDFRPIGGECRSDVIQRYHAVFARIVTEHGTLREPTSAICVVAHGTGIRILLEDLGIGGEIHPQGKFQIIEYRENGTAR